MCHGEYSQYVSRRLQAVCGNHGEAILRHIRSGPFLGTEHWDLQAAKLLLYSETKKPPIGGFFCFFMIPVNFTETLIGAQEGTRTPTTYVATTSR